MPNYHIYDLRVESDLELPANPLTDEAFRPGKRVCISHQPASSHEFDQAHWISSRYGGLIRCYDVGNGILVSVGGGTGSMFRFWVSRKGDEIVLGTLCSEAAAMIPNLGLSICKLLQGHLTLHGASLEICGKLIGLLAHSQSGKSTLLWTLLDRGARIASDDVIPIHLDSSKVMATPSVSLHAKLSGVTLDRQDVDTTALQPVLADDDQFWLPFCPDAREVEPRPLEALFLLQPDWQAEAGSVQVQRVSGGGVISLLMDNTHGLWAAYPMLDGKRIFAILAALVESIPIYTLRYARCYEILPALAAAIQDHITGGRPVVWKTAGVHSRAIRL